MHMGIHENYIPPPSPSLEPPKIPNPEQELLLSHAPKFVALLKSSRLSPDEQRKVLGLLDTTIRHLDRFKPEFEKRKTLPNGESAGTLPQFVFELLAQTVQLEFEELIDTGKSTLIEEDVEEFVAALRKWTKENIGATKMN